jgi:carbonic anhydrase/acetyltransferase-like protein (isoleucine patch superfamily)
MTPLSYRAEDNIRPFGEHTPILGERVMIDPSAVVIGQVDLGDDVSIWPQCSIRADMHTISIGERSNVQDNAVLHVTHASGFNPKGWPLILGTDVTVGHSTDAPWEVAF